MQTFPWSDLCTATIRWESRAENAESCAARLARYLTRLKPLHPCVAALCSHFAPRLPLYPVPAQSDDYVRSFKKRYATAKKGKPRSVDRLHFRAVSHFGTGRHLSLYIDAGMIGAEGQDPAKVQQRLNLVQLSTVVKDVGGEDALMLASFKAMLLAAIDTWNPDYGGLFSHNYGQLSHDPNRLSPFSSGSWAIYLAPHLTERVVPPEGGLTEPVIGGGLLMQATEGYFSHTNRKHREAAELIHAAILPVGL